MEITKKINITNLDINMSKQAQNLLTNSSNIQIHSNKNINKSNLICKKVEVNTKLCYARKNQNTEYFVQCPHNKKFGNFCGKHKNYLIKKLIPINEEHPLKKQEKLNKINNLMLNSENNLELDKIKSFQKIMKKYQENFNKNSEHSNDKNGKELKTNNKKTKKRNDLVINPLDFYKYNNKYLSILDYLYDKSLKCSQTQLKNSFNFYKLKKFSKSKKLSKEETNIYYRQKLSSLFETLLLSYVFIEKIIKIQRLWKTKFLNKKLRLHGPAYIKGVYAIMKLIFIVLIQ